MAEMGEMGYGYQPPPPPPPAEYDAAPQSYYDERQYGHAHGYPSSSAAEAGGSMPAPPPTMDPGPARDVLAEDVILLRQEVAQAEAARDHAVAERNKLEAYKLGVESMLNEHELLRNNKMLFANFEIQKKQLSECTRKAKQAYALEQQVRELKTELALRPPAPAAGGSERKLEDAIRSLTEEVSTYMQELEAASEAMDESQQECARMQGLVDRQRQTQAKLHEQMHSNVLGRKQAESRCQDLKDKAVKQARQHELRLGAINQKQLENNRLRERLRQHGEQAKKDIAAANARLKECQGDLEAARAECRTLEGKNEQLNEELTRHQDKRRRLDHGGGGGGADMGGAGGGGVGMAGSKGEDKEMERLRKQVKNYQTKVLCQICSDRNKTHIVVPCLHMFCGECINKSLDSRNRKCPSCGQKFQKSDLRKVHF